MNIVELNIDKLIELCEQHKVKELCLFGSVLTDKFNDQSDIDMLVRFNSDIDVFTYFDNYMDLKEEFELLLHRSVDLVEEQAIKNPIFKQIVEREKKLVYERKRD